MTKLRTHSVKNRKKGLKSHKKLKKDALTSFSCIFLKQNGKKMST